MALFVILGLMTVAAMALLVVPLLRGHGAIASRADYDIEIYRDQLAELGRDVERGVIDAMNRRRRVPKSSAACWPPIPPLMTNPPRTPVAAASLRLSPS